MHTQILETHAAAQPKNRQLILSRSKPAKTAVRLVLSAAVVLGIGFTTWGMLRAQFAETFSEFPACHVVAPDRAA